MSGGQRPQKIGLYDPAYEHDACGVGFVAKIDGTRNHEILRQSEEILVNMSHRGAVGAEVNTGDGAGVLTALPYDLLERVVREELGVDVPPEGRLAAGVVFLSRYDEERDACKAAFERICNETGERFLAWRPVPVREAGIGPSARASQPTIEMALIVSERGGESFERNLYRIRKRAGNEIRASRIDPGNVFYVCSLSSRVIVYKGMVTPEQLFAFYADLSDPAYTTHLAMVHSRFSTNTFPSWDRAQPLRVMSHNGEINTLRGNENKMRAREGQMKSELFGDRIGDILPVVEPDLSDSGTFDNVLELLLMTGRELPEAVMMMIPEAWQTHPHMPQKGRDMYEYMSAQMEPWDGPASIVFTDGRVIGAVLDRNGLRPSRYYVTQDGTVVMASEVGVLAIEEERVASKGRLQPGRMFLVDFEQKRIVDDEELKNGIADRHPYGEWISRQKLTIGELPAAPGAPGLDEETILPRLRAFGFTIEHLQMIIKPMAETSKEPLGSMGNDTPLAVLSNQPRLVYDYFKQLFAQVTNPPIDSIREATIMSLAAYIGPEGNLLTREEHHVHRLFLEQPILTNAETAKIKSLEYRDWTSTIIDTTFRAAAGESALESAIERVCTEADEAVRAGFTVIVLSDRAVGETRAPISALLAVGAVHHRLVRTHKRTRVALVVESGEPREVHHFCTLVGYGADAVNPYLAYEAMWKLRKDGQLETTRDDAAIVDAYRGAINKGMRKVFGKMGISTLESYKGAQIFEAVGIADPVISRCFAGTASRIQGIGFEGLAREGLRRHELAFPRGNRPIGGDYLNTGDYQYRFGGEMHMWDPQSIADLQIAVRTDDYGAFKRFSERQNQRSTSQATLRGLLRLRKGTPVSIEEVEPVEAITRRFVTGAMSFGSISLEAHETLAVAMNRIGGKSNTGEGGEIPSRFIPLDNGDSKRSAIKQVASGRFGVNIDYLVNADEIQIKMAQGAKPGEGGELPGHKVFDIIAKTRFSTPGVGLISPPPHHDIYSIEDLAQLIFDLKNANPNARISVKLVSEVGVGTVAAGVAKAHADHILVSGHDGGTGASPLTGIKHAGLPWELGLAETHQTLVLNDLRSRVVVQTDGQLKTGRDVVIAALLGAEEMGFATGALVSMGCIMMRKCEKNTCPVGIATQDEELRRKFAGSPEHVVRFMQYVAQEAREIMAELGFRTIDEMVGRVDILEVDEQTRNWKAEGVDLSPLLEPIVVSDTHSGVICCVPQDHGIDDVLDRKLIDAAAPLFDSGEAVYRSFPIRNTDRTVGAMLSGRIAEQIGPYVLEEDTVVFDFAGSAGQSFGAFLAQGVTFSLAGDANDYVGKGLSGGKLVIRPSESAGYAAEENVIIGNVSFYGATGGNAFIRGIASERFCVRNSGAGVVVEGVGLHGCEYMTGGRAYILGGVGRNFAAGMSGGIAFVWDPAAALERNINGDLAEIYPLSPGDEEDVLTMIREHRRLTGSSRADQIIGDWETQRGLFRKVVAPEYARVLETQRVREAVHG